MSEEKRKNILIIITLVAVGLLIMDKFIFTPATAKWNSSGQRISELTATLNKADQVLTQEKAWIDRQNDIIDSAFSTDSAVMEHEVLEVINKISAAQHIDLKSMRTQWVSSKKGEPLYLRVQVEADGDLNKVSSWLYDVENSTKPFRLINLTIRSESNKGDNLSVETLIEVPVIKLKGDA